MSLRIAILGSGSSGNSVFAATDHVRVLFDAGFSYRQLALRLQGIGESPEQLDAVVVSHEHSDHIAGLRVLFKRTGIPLYITRPTAETIEWKDPRPKMEFFEAGRSIGIGDLKIDTFTTPHDAVDPVGFRLQADGAPVGIATDLGYMPESVKRHIRDCELLILESNHDVEMLKFGPYPWHVKQRVMSRNGHLSNHNVAEFLVEDFDRRARAVVLAHLSGHNNCPYEAHMSAQQALERVGASHTQVHVASQSEPSEVFEL